MQRKDIIYLSVIVLLILTIGVATWSKNPLNIEERYQQFMKEWETQQIRIELRELEQQMINERGYYAPYTFILTANEEMSIAAGQTYVDILNIESKTKKFHVEVIPSEEGRAEMLDRLGYDPYQIDIEINVDPIEVTLTPEEGTRVYINVLREISSEEDLRTLPYVIQIFADGELYGDMYTVEGVFPSKKQIKRMIEDGQVD